MSNPRIREEYETQAAEKGLRTRHLLELVQYLSVPRTFDEISIRLALSVFAEDEVQAVYLGLLESDGIVHEAGHYGYLDSECAGPISIPIRHSTPIQKVLKFDRAFIYQNAPELFEEFEDGSRYPLPAHWKTLSVLPIGDLGVVAIFFKNEIQEELEFQLHLQTIGAVIAMYILRNKNGDQVEAVQDHQITSQTNSSMSERQIVILKMIERGLTNAEIAKEVGYSESLVRQETVQIFRKLRVTGRKEILNHSNGVAANKR